MISDDYAAQLQKEHAGSKWGSTAWRYGGDDVVTLIKERAYIRSVLDFGCGKGTMQEHVQPQIARQLEWVEYDPGIPGKDVLPNRRFDLVLTCDVLEHVEPACLTSTIDTLGLLTGSVLYNNIACYPTGKTFGEGPYIHQDLHLMIAQPSWWRYRFEGLDDAFKLFEYRHIERMRQGNLQPRCVLVHERVA